MNTKSIKTLFALATASVVSFANLNAADITVDRIINSSTTWTADNTYILDGYTFVVTPDGASETTVLMIEPGTVIKGAVKVDQGSEAAALVITRGAQINAQGTAAEPIIFTSELDDLAGGLTSEDVGLWGGLVLLGNAQINSRADGTVVSAPVADQIEGFSVANEETDLITFGGTDDADNSGIIRYVSIRHGGEVLGTANEINGLTLGGVGSGTTIEYVEIFANKDDGVEFFGGTVNVKNLVVAFSADDAIDLDQGYRGKIQYAFVIGNDIGDDRADKGGEWDGSTSPLDAQPYGKAQFANITMVGIGDSLQPDGSTPGRSNVAMNIRDGVSIDVWNSIFTEFTQMILLENDLLGGSTPHYAFPDDFQIAGNIFWSHISENNTAAGLNAAPDANYDASLFFTDSAFGNDIADPMLGGISRSADGGLDPIPGEGSPAYSGALTLPDDGFFDATDYRGAFSAERGNWAAGWTKLWQDGYFGGWAWVETSALGLVWTAGPIEMGKWIYVYDLNNWAFVYGELDQSIAISVLK